MVCVAVLDGNAEYHERALCLAQRLQLPLLHAPHADYSYYLEYQQGRLQLRAATQTSLGPLVVDFAQGSLGFRARHSVLSRELLIRAAGLINSHEGRTVLDATAGLGCDSFMLALAGAQVTAIEHAPVVAALLQDGLDRARSDETTVLVAQRVTFHEADAVKWITQSRALFDVVYLDPLFPERKKSALVKKDMQYLQAIATPTLDADVLFAAAYACAKERIVVKRPGRVGHLSDKKPTYSLSGPSIRFDVYRVSKVYG